MCMREDVRWMAATESRVTRTVDPVERIVATADDGPGPTRYAPRRPWRLRQLPGTALTTLLWWLRG
jgi:hypothetical protein